MPEPYFLILPISGRDPSNLFTIYSVALPKAQAHCQLDSYGREIGLGLAIANTESWKMVMALGQDQNDTQLRLMTGFPLKPTG